MKLPRLLSTILVSSLAVVGFAASAAQLNGSVSSIGTLCLGPNPGMVMGVQCAAQDASTLRYLDFVNGGSSPLSASPGTPGSLRFLTGADSFLPLIGQTGTINDFALPGASDPLSSFSSVDPLWTATGTDGAMYSYVLSALTAIERSIANALDVRGTGTVCRNGSDCNLFSFLFTTQSAGSATETTFSMSQSGFGKVPEPASLALLGLGLAGLAFGARRRVK